MSAIRACLPVLLASILGLTATPSASADPFFYGVGSNGEFLKINLDGSATLIGQMTVDGSPVYELQDVVQTASGLYAIASRGKLVKVDPNTATATMVNPLDGFPYTEGLALDPSGNIYGSSSLQPNVLSNLLTRIPLDPVSKIPSSSPLAQIGPFGPQFTDIQDIAFQPGTGTLFGVNLDLATQTQQLVTIDPTTGLATKVADLSRVVAGLDFAPDGMLYGSTLPGINSPPGGGPSDLVRIDPITGAVTTLGPILFPGNVPAINVQGVLFVVPEPSSWILLGLGGVGLLGLTRRKRRYVETDEITPGSR